MKTPIQPLSETHTTGYKAQLDGVLTQPKGNNLEYHILCDYGQDFTMILDNINEGEEDVYSSNECTYECLEK